MEELPGAGRRRVLVLVLVVSWLCSSLLSQFLGDAAPHEGRMVVVRDSLPVVTRVDNATLVVSLFNAETRERKGKDGKKDPA